MIKKILLVLAIAAAAFCAVVSLQPSQFRIARSAVIPAPPAAVFAQVNDFHAWEAWSPWAKMDPDSKTVFEGPESGKGAVFKWSGNKDVGEGVMTITESRPYERILINLEFIKPFAGTNLTEFTFEPEGSGTRVTWTMSGENSFIGKAMSLVINCDKMVGEQFEKGLANITSAVSAKSTP